MSDIGFEYPKQGSEKDYAREQLAALRAEKADHVRRIIELDSQIPMWEERAYGAQSVEQSGSSHPAADGLGESVTYGG